MSPGTIVAEPTPDGDRPLTWSSGAMTTAGFAAVCAEVLSRDRPSVVECGAGFSTLKLAELIHQRGGHLVSLEHDATWALRVRRALAAAGFAETAHVTLAPLEPHPLALDGLPWYAEHGLSGIPRHIDVLLIDGPPAFEPAIELSRYPALPVFAERLAAGAVVILDDIHRRGELRILEAWERSCGYRFKRLPAERIALGRRP